jgi:hypothetical protein
MGKACAVALSDMVDALLLVDLDAEAAAATAKELTDRRAASTCSSTAAWSPRSVVVDRG